MTILITGNCGYIGSHISRLFAEEGLDIIGFDNLVTGNTSNSAIDTVIADVRSAADLRYTFDKFAKLGAPIDTVFHLAALTSVPESEKYKDEYFAVNVEGTINLLDTMEEFNCNKLVFSSTSSIYRQSQEPLKETDVLQPLNHYALTKHLAEQCIKKRDWLDYIIFRYFNVIGYENWYDYSNEMKKTNIVPALLRCVKYNKDFEVYGNCYPVKREDINDKTCIRDYIDVRDIAEAHVQAISYLESHSKCKETFNLGTEKGTSVLEFIKTFEKANNVKVLYKIEKSRKGDPASLIANNSKAKQLLGWKPKYTLQQSLEGILNLTKEKD